MSAVDYLALVAAFFGFAGVGRLIVRGNDALANAFLGLLFCAGIAASLCWTYPVAVSPFFRGMIAAGLIVLGRDVVLRNRAGTLPPAGMVAQAVLAIVIAGAWVYDLHWRFHHTDSEDVYFSPMVEMLRADYLGPLRAFTHYPDPLKALHIASSAVWAGLCALMAAPTMIHGLEARYVLEAVVVGHCGLRLYRWLKRPAWVFLPVALATLYVVDGELRATLYTSSQLYFLTMLELATLAVTADDTDPAVPRQALALAIALAMLKTSIFYLPVVLAGYYLLRFPRTRFDPAVLGMAAVVAAQMLTVMSRPIPVTHARLSPSLANPFGPRPALDFDPVVMLGGGTLDLPVRTYVALAAVLYLVKATLLPAAAYRSLGGGGGQRQILINGILLSTLAVLFSWVLMRNSQMGTVFVQWAAVMGVAPLAVGAVAVATRPGAWAWRAGLAGGVLVLALAIGHVPWRGTPNFGGLTYDDLMRRPKAELLTRIGDEDPGNVAIRALMLGERLPAATTPLENTGLLINFIVTEGK